MPVSEADVGEVVGSGRGVAESNHTCRDPALMSSTAELDKAMEEARQKTRENGRGQRIN